MVTFSEKLRRFLVDEKPKTIKDLIDNFADKSFAILFLLLLAISALPLPTGGITHIFEIIAMLLALELIAGRKTVWLPRKWLNKTLPKSLQSSALPRLIKILRWAEKHSRSRLVKVEKSRLYLMINGLFLLLFTAFAFLAPPFSGLDTLPSLGVVLLSIGLILDDFLFSVAGLIIGSIGIVLVLVLGSLVFKLF